MLLKRSSTQCKQQDDELPQMKVDYAESDMQYPSPSLVKNKTLAPPVNVV